MLQHDLVEDRALHSGILVTPSTTRACPAQRGGRRCAPEGVPERSARQRMGDAASAEREPRVGLAVRRQLIARDHRPRGSRPLAHSSQGLGVLQRIVNREPFGPGRRQQRVIRRDKQGWRHPPLVHQTLHRQGAGQLDRVIGP